MTRLDITPSANADISEIIDFLEREAGAPTALRYAQRFDATLNRLLVFPNSGAPRPALGAHTRLVVIAPYLLLYDYVSTTDLVTVLRVVHGKSLITEEALRRN